jgi:hypothetical protein
MIKYARFLMAYSDFFKNYEKTEQKLNLLVENNQEAKEVERSIKEEGN